MSLLDWFTPWRAPIQQLERKVTDMALDTQKLDEGFARLTSEVKEIGDEVAALKSRLDGADAETQMLVDGIATKLNGFADALDSLQTHPEPQPE